MLVEKFTANRLSVPKQTDRRRAGGAVRAGICKAARPHSREGPDESALNQPTHLLPCESLDGQYSSDDDCDPIGLPEFEQPERQAAVPAPRPFEEVPAWCCLQGGSTGADRHRAYMTTRKLTQKRTDVEQLQQDIARVRPESEQLLRQAACLARPRTCSCRTCAKRASSSRDSVFHRGCRSVVLLVLVLLAKIKFMRLLSAVTQVRLSRRASETRLHDRLRRRRHEREIPVIDTRNAIMKAIEQRLQHPARSSFERLERKKEDPTPHALPCLSSLHAASHRAARARCRPASRTQGVLALQDIPPSPQHPHPQQGQVLTLQDAPPAHSTALECAAAAPPPQPRHADRRKAHPGGPQKHRFAAKRKGVPVAAFLSVSDERAYIEGIDVQRSHSTLAQNLLQRLAVFTAMKAAQPGLCTTAGPPSTPPLGDTTTTTTATSPCPDTTGSPRRRQGFQRHTVRGETVKEIVFNAAGAPAIPKRGPGVVPGAPSAADPAAQAGAVGRPPLPPRGSGAEFEGGVVGCAAAQAVPCAVLPSPPRGKRRGLGGRGGVVGVVAHATTPACSSLGDALFGGSPAESWAAEVNLLADFRRRSTPPRVRSRGDAEAPCRSRQVGGGEEEAQAPGASSLLSRVSLMMQPAEIDVAGAAPMACRVPHPPAGGREAAAAAAPPPMAPPGTLPQLQLGFAAASAAALPRPREVLSEGWDG